MSGNAAATASASANYSEAERGVIERSGGEPLPEYVADPDVDTDVVDTGRSITQRCRKRSQWAKGEDLTPNKDDWVCQDANCQRPVCAAYHAYEGAVSALDQIRAQRDQASDAQPSEREMQMGQRIVDLEKRGLVHECEVLEVCHERMKDLLIYGKAAGNKTEHKTLYTNKDKIEGELQATDEADPGNGGAPTSPSKLFDAMNNHMEEYDVPTLNDIFTKLEIGPEDERRGQLHEFYIYCDRLLYQSIESKNEYMSTKYAKDIQVTVKEIVEWEPGDKVEQGSRFYRPSHQAQETRGVHPILLALMWKINSILKGTTHFMSEQYLPKQLEKSKRWMDALWSKAVQHFLSRANGNLIGKSCEFKPISRSGDGYHKMVDEGINQDLGHSLQVLWDSCYQFSGGLGKDGETSGIVLTMISASLLESTLTGVGTKDVDLKISCKRDMPLFSEETTKKLADREFGSLGLTFVPTALGRTRNSTDLPMQQGFIALVDFISNEGTPQDSTPLSLASGGRSISADTVEYLGSGAFCSVYKCKVSDETGNGTRAVLKMSKDRDSTALIEEVRALKALTHEAIPKLLQDNLVTVTVKARCERKQVQGLLLNLATGTSLKQPPENVRFQDVLNAIEGVLDYAHGKGWYHLDVQPSNIIAVINGNGTCRYMLIDWGTAVNEKKKLTSFHGSPPFAHPDMFFVKESEKDKSQWSGPTPKAEFDKYSLAMTLAYIEHKGVPWSGFHKKVVTYDMLQDRYGKAVQLINKSALDQPSKNKVLGWIPKPATPSSQQQPKAPTAKSPAAKKRSQASSQQQPKTPTAKSPAAKKGKPRRSQEEGKAAKRRKTRAHDDH